MTLQKLQQELHKILDDLAAEKKIEISAYWYQEINVLLDKFTAPDRIGNPNTSKRSGDKHE